MFARICMQTDGYPAVEQKKKGQQPKLRRCTSILQHLIFFSTSLTFVGYLKSMFSVCRILFQPYPLTFWPPLTV